MEDTFAKLNFDTGAKVVDPAIVNEPLSTTGRHEANDGRNEATNARDYDAGSDDHFEPGTHMPDKPRSATPNEGALPGKRGE